MLGTDRLRDKLTTVLGNSPSVIKLTQISTSSFFTKNSINKVADVGSLPSAANNKGRLIYVISEQSYYFSNGTSWSNDFTASV